jgi:peptidoglycan hydrolase-like protein with peptidoglycan-binding domain
MIKNKKLFYGAFGVIALGSYLVYRFYSKTKSGQDLTYAESVKEDVNTATKTVVDKVLPVASYPLKVGSKGSNVIILQKWLNDNGYASPKLVPDADFGTKTESAVKEMQEYANDKRIIDYNLWSSDYKNGQITQDFYQIFIIKTKAVPSKGASGIDFNLGLGF